MPFPLAHPAAVLPLRRYCPRWLNFPALVAGSISPDLGYLFGETGIADVSHTVLGGLGFGLVASLFMLGAFYALGKVAIPRVPSSVGEKLRPFWQPVHGPALTIVVSICIGIGTHLLLDSFTHTHGWLVLHLNLLQQPVLVLFGRQVKVCHILWYACSFVGIAWLVLALRAWQAVQPSHSAVPSRPVRLLEALLVATLVLPIELLHHLVRSRLGLAVVGGLSLLLLVGLLARITWSERT